MMIDAAPNREISDLTGVNGIKAAASQASCVPDLSTDCGLRAALSQIAREPENCHSQLWDEIGAQIVTRAHRDAQPWQRHAAEYAGAYVVAAVETLKLRPKKIWEARSPWGVLVTIGRRAGTHAVGADLACGLTARELATHGFGHDRNPTVVSLDTLTDAIEYTIMRRPW
jgi:hypothetical protein